jgi:hypothetical protein
VTWLRTSSSGVCFVDMIVGGSSLFDMVGFTRFLLFESIFLIRSSSIEATDSLYAYELYLVALNES